MRSLSLNMALVLIAIIAGASNCSKKETEINYDVGTFPEEVLALEDINSAYDDYNLALPQFAGNLPLMFSSNRNSQGGNFDIVSGEIYFVFSRIDAGFTLSGSMLNESFYENLQNAVNTSADELGPYRFFNSLDGKEYFFYSSEDEQGKLNIKFLSYSPVGTGGSFIPGDPLSANALNSSGNDAYICFNRDISKVYFTSDRNGDFDIVESEIGIDESMGSWLSGDPVTVTATDSINSEYDDKCPFIRRDIMVFSSNRPGGMGGYDLYYSVFRNEKWSSPVNMGPSINTSDNEYRPVLGNFANFSNNFLMFSSDRPGGKGGFDLYFRGISIETGTEE